MKRKVILDCDPGHDDAVAILLAAGSPEVDLLAITTVAGNQTLDKTSLNARRVCAVAGIRDVPLAAGCDRPLIRPLRTAADVHGESGLDGVDWPEPDVFLAATHAVDLIVDLVMGSPGDVTLVPVGPLTNVATALAREPRLAANVREVVLMGGSFTRGNVTPAAEFNIFVDPEAASAVFEAAWPVTMVGLDLTHQARATPEISRRIEALDTPLADAVSAMLAFYGRDAGTAGPPVHDPCAIARVINPGLVRCEPAFVAVETSGRWSAGMTVTDFLEHPERPFNAQVATALDFDGFWDLVIEAIGRLGGSSH